MGATTQACPTATPEPTPTATPEPTATPDLSGPTLTPTPDSKYASLPSEGFQLDGKVQLTFAADASLTIKTGTQRAVDEWNRAMPWKAEGGNVEFCHRSGDTTTLPSSTICTPPAKPNKSVDDGRTVTITTIDGETSDHCIRIDSLACIKPVFREGQAIENQTIYIKDPAYIPNDYGELETIVIWTLDPNRHNEGEEDENGNVTSVELYLPAVIMHELGHAAGLGELRDMPEYEGTVMHWNTDDFTDETEPTDIVELTTVSDTDAEYLRYNQQQGANTQSGRIRRKVTR